MRTLFLQNGGSITASQVEVLGGGLLRLTLPNGGSISLPSAQVVRVLGGAPPAAPRPPMTAGRSQAGAAPASDPYQAAAAAINSGAMPFWKAAESLGFDGSDMSMVQAEEAFRARGIKIAPPIDPNAPPPLNYSGPWDDEPPAGDLK